MNLKVKILLISLAITVCLGSVLAVILEYSMSVGTKNEIEIAERKAQTEREQQAAIEAEKQYQEEVKVNAMNKYDKVEDYYHGLALAKKGDKYGYIDSNGVEVIPVQYEVANNFTSSKYAKVKKDGKWGYIDNTGKPLIPIEYSYCGEVSEGMVAVGNGGKYGFMSVDGKVICELKYDKVEAFSATNGLAKVVLDQKYGYIDKNGKEVVEIAAPYVESNMDFTGEWKGTDTHSSKAGIVTIGSQIATSFNFEILAKYFSKSGTIKGTADIIKPNLAEYRYNNGEVADTLTFSIIDGTLIITAQNGGHCGMDAEVTASGSYTLDAPKYTNADVMSKVFDDDEKLYSRIKNALGEEVYGEYFLYGFKNGEYKVVELDDASDVIKGDLYTVTIPTMKKDFKLLISKDNIYFFAKDEAIYKTDDINREAQAKMPSAIAFDEL